MEHYFFAVKDGGVNADTGDKEDAGMAVKISGINSADEVMEYLERAYPCYRGRLRQITREEYDREYGCDE